MSFNCKKRYPYKKFSWARDGTAAETLSRCFCAFVKFPDLSSSTARCESLRNLGGIASSLALNSTADGSLCRIISTLRVRVRATYFYFLVPGQVSDYADFKVVISKVDAKRCLGFLRRALPKRDILLLFMQFGNRLAIEKGVLLRSNRQLKSLLVAVCFF